MKNEIDDLLNSMFRNGKLNVRSGEKQSGDREQAPVPVLEWDPGETATRAGKAAESVEKAQKEFSGSLEKSIEQLTRETQSEINKLERQLEQDGMENTSAGNAGNTADLEAAFSKAWEEVRQKVLGQEEFLSGLTVALKRPFVAGTKPGAPLGRVALLGKPGTGRHMTLEIMLTSLARQGVLKSPKLIALDLSRYGEAGSEKLFVQDLYCALKSGASALAFERFEQACPAVLSLVSALFREGSVPLAGRYAEQKGMLVEIGAALVPGAVSSLSAEGRYLVLLTEESEDKVADAFGMQFLSALDDLCKTGEFSRGSLEKLSGEALDRLCSRLREKLGFTFTYDDSAVKALQDCFRPEQGVPSLQEQADGLYRSLGELRLRQGAKPVSGVLFGDGGQLCARYGTDGAEEVLRPAGDSGAAAREAAVQAVKQELSEIVGLKEVKEYILTLEDNFKIQQLRREKGLKAESPSMHMIFTGNPGTGKTTVARIVARYLKAIGVLQGGQLVEVTRADLVGKYVGHTAPLTQQAIQSALGGVLFVDEAYSLYRGKDDSFGLEAIDTLVKGMEDHRDELLVILAGYSHEMEEFLTANSGLRSRFPNIIEFPDYTGEELMAITRSIVKGKGYRLDESCEKPLLEYFEKAQREGDPRTGGNGRMARNKVEEAVLACSRRNLKSPEEQRDLELLLPEDFGV